jgi:hypothetical protein
MVGSYSHKESTIQNSTQIVFCKYKAKVKMANIDKHASLICENGWIFLEMRGNNLELY